MLTLPCLIAIKPPIAIFSIAIINPHQGRDFAKATGQLAKTDTVNACILVHFAEAIAPQPGSYSPNNKLCNTKSGVVDLKYEAQEQSARS